jgi:hypothetical protein
LCRAALAEAALAAAALAAAARRSGACRAAMPSECPGKICKNIFYRGMMSSLQ